MDASAPAPLPQAPNIPVKAFVDAFARTRLLPLRGDYFQTGEPCRACALTALVFAAWANGRSGAELGAEYKPHPRGIGLLVESAIRERYSWSFDQIEAFIDGFDGDRYRCKAPPAAYRTWYAFGAAVFAAVSIAAAANFPDIDLDAVCPDIVLP